MEILTPQYYENFKCIAEKCRHSCCVGWEIDVDSDSLEKYMADKSEYGKKIMKNIDTTTDGAHFCLDENERCPLLNDDGLCDIIIQKGEDYLCNICRDHPRFRNFFSGHTEMGIGMCCEEATRIILNCTKAFDEVFPVDIQCGTDEEKDFLTTRKKVFDIMCDRTKKLDCRINCLFEKFGLETMNFDLRDAADELSQMEILDESWSDCIEMLSETEFFDDEIFESEYWENVFEQLISYFLFRHLPGALDDGRFNERITFCVLGYRIIKALCAGHKSRYGNIEFEDVCMYCRMFSSEIEYSDENTRNLIDYVMFC